MTDLDRMKRLERLSPAKRALLARALRESPPRTPERGIPRRRGSGPAPLSSSQKRMWLAQLLDPGSPAGNMPMALRLESRLGGRLDVPALAAALGEVVRRHEVLRTALLAPEGEPFQTVLPAAPFLLPLVDLTGIPQLSAREAQRLAAVEALRPFDLGRPPLLRAALARLAADSHLLLLTVHHAAADGWSNAILIRDVAALYGACSAGQRPQLPAPPLQYADYAIWQHERLAAGGLAAELAADLRYWRERLAGLAPQELPADRPPERRASASSAPALRRSEALPPRVADRLQELAGREGATMFMLLAAAFAAFLGRLADRDDVAFATPVAGRTRVETEEVVGCFVNTLILRADLSGGLSFRALLARLRSAVADAHRHQELPFERLVEELAPERQPGRHPLVQTLFTLRNVAAEPVSLRGLAVTPVAVPTGAALFDLALEVEPAGGMLTAHLELDGALWDPPAAPRLLQQFLGLLAAVAADAEAAVAQLPLLTPAARHQVLAEWQGGELRDRLGGPLPIGVPGFLPDGRRARRRADGGVEILTPPPSVAPGAGAPPEPAGENETARTLAAIWAEVLGRPAVGVHDSFWELGGHSLLAARVTARVRSRLGVDLPLRAVFDAPTPAELAVVVAGGKPAAAPPVRRGVPHETGPRQLSFGQRRLWLYHQLLPESPAYNIPLGLRIEGTLDVRALAAALSGVVMRHEVLRTAIVTRRGEAVQEVAPAAPLPLPVVDLTRVPVARSDGEARRLMAEEGRRPFDLASPPLLRALLLRQAPELHRLVLNLHHIAGDGWSGAVLVREAVALYSACAAGRPAVLSRLPLQYADYARWQREQLDGETLARLVAFWRQRLEDLPPLALPTDHPRPAAESFRGLRRAHRLEAPLAAALERLAESRGATLFMVLAAGFAALLGRLSGQEDFGLAAPVAGRDRPELESLIGFFVNTLVLRADLAGDPPFDELLARSKETALAAFAHQELPFERLVEELGGRRDPARQPLAQALIVLQSVPREPLVVPGLVFSPEDVESGTAKLDLGLDLERQEDGIAAGLEVNRDLCDATTAARILEQLRALLAAAAIDPRRRLSALPLLGPAAEHQLVLEWNDAASVPEPRELLLHRRFEAVAARCPHAVAVSGEGLRLTYGELDRRANRLARHLRALGVGPEVGVGLCLPRSPELIVAMLAVAKAGGAYVPLDPDDPRERLELLIADAGVGVVVTGGPQSPPRPPGEGGQGGEAPLRVDLAADAAAIARRSPRPLADGAGPDQLAYVIYTSGSTGRPKGVTVTHRNVARLFAATAPWFDFGREDVWTLFHSFAFDFSVWETWGPLLTGGRVVVVPYWVSRAPDELLELVCREGVTVLNQTPSAFRLLIRAACAAPKRHLPLRLVIFGGEALDPRHLAPWIELYGDRRPRLINMFGITETTVHVTCRPLSLADAAAARSPIGRPIPDLRIRLVDRALRPVPIGVPGELCVGGAGLARGYLGRPELTAARFIPDALRAGERLYRSGDLARRLPDGDLEVLGRIDHQVKVRGFRIELGEIEAALEAHPGVQASVAAARDDDTGGRQLAAYVVARRGAPEPSAGELRTFLRGRLPGHMIPAVFISLAALPLTPHGKLDRAALPAPPRDAGPAGAVPLFSPPETPVERALAAAWSAVLGRPRIGLDDDFFALGGDSIRGIQVRIRAEERGVRFTLQDLFQHPTIRALAATVHAAPAVPAAVAAAGTPDLLSAEDRGRLPADVEDAFPLARALAGFVFHAELSPDYLIYVTSLHLQAPFDRPFLERALAQVVARHPMLRSSFALEGFSEPLQLVHREVRVPLAVEDLRSLSPAEQEETLGRWLAAEQCRRFDWRRPPLVRLTVHRRSATTLQLTLSEPFLDGWSVGLFLTELFQRYLALLPPGTVPGLAAADLPPLEDRPLAASFRDFVALEREALASPACRAFWRERMDGGGACRLPRRRGRLDEAADPTHTLVGHLDVPVPRPVSDGLWAAARGAGAPIKDLLLAVHLKALSLLTGSRDVVSGVLANGRPEGADGDRVLGGFLNAMPFRLALAPGAWSALARQVFAAERAWMPYRRFPLSEIAEWMPKEPGAGGMGRPLVDALFNFTHFHVYERLERLPGVAALGSWGSEQTYFPLTAQFNVHEIDHRVALSLDYRRDALDAPEVEDIAGRYARILESVAAAPDAPHDGLCLLTEAERQQVVVEWNDSALAPSPLEPDTVAERFLAWAERAPDAPAVLWAEQTVTYGGLAARASWVARRLAALGLRAEDRVGILLDRSPDLVAAILGTLQAGAAYVPLDPAYPRERLDAMLGDSGARALVTRAGLGPWAAAERPGWVRIDMEAATVLGLKPQATSSRPPGDTASQPGPGGGVLSRSGRMGGWSARGRTEEGAAGLFAVIYTSGSTGRPKGVAVRQESVLSFLAGAAALYPHEARAGMLAAASVCFDLSVFELFLPLTHGGAAVLAETVLDFPRLPARDAVRLMAMVPSAASELLRMGGLPAAVQTVVMGGEALPSGLARELCDERPGRRIFNAYGPTEATIYSLIAPVPAALASLPPIGRPAPGERVLLLDADLQPVLPGVAGEICLAGDGLARGYLGRPERTAERFLPDPWAGAGGARLYRSGDLGRRMPDGQIEFLGRRDQQVKVRGFRIELGDIEAALARHPGIENAVVVDRREPGSPGDARLVAYVMPRRGAPASEPWAAELRAFLQRMLPAYMVPSDFVVLDALPLTSTGKVDRRALPAPRRDGGPAHPASSAPPRTPIEEVLCGIWAEVFALPRVGSDADFFALGGHSLLATRLVSRLRAAFGLDLPLHVLFDAPVLADLAHAIERALLHGGGTAAPPLAAVPRPASGAPLSFAQQRLWFLDRLEPGSPFYNVPTAVRLRGRMEVAALGAAFREIVCRHEALRTRFGEVAGQPVQVVLPAAAAPAALPVVDLGGLPAHLREAIAERLGVAESRRPFELARGPLLRLLLLRLAPEDHLLLAVFHHIVSDGWSMGVFLRETAELYRACLAGEPSPLPALPLQYADFALWQRSWLHGEALEAQLAYWRRQLAGVPPLELPTDRPRPATPAYRGARCALTLPAALAAALAARCRREGVTLFMTLHAALAAVLGRWSDQELLAVGTPIASRTRVELEPLIGFFVNTLVLRADLAGDPTVRELLGRCRETALGAYAHQDLPFEKLVAALRPERELARAPLFQVLLALQNTPLPALDLPGLSLAAVEVEAGTAKFDLTLSVAETAGGVAGWLEHDAHLFDPATASRLAGHLAVVLRTVAEDPARRLSDAPMLTAEESRQVLAVWAAGRALPDGAEELNGIEERIVAQARKTPQALAVVQGGRVLTYGDLAARSAALAADLRASGVGPEAIVAIHLPKSPDAIVAILGVLRSGGAYLPLDPSYPEERLEWIRRDAGASVILTGADVAVAPPSPPSAPPAAAPARAAAYVLYTSGSTGRPKGVVVTRAGLAASTLARLPGYTAPVSAFLLLPSLAFDSSVAGLFWTLCVGGTLVLPEEGEAADPWRLARLVAAHRVSHWLSIPSLWSLVLDQAPPDLLRSLAAVIVAGEGCPADLPRRHAAALPGVRLLNEYGPTEGTVWATAGELPAGDRITIGRPIAGARVLLLDRLSRPVPAGVPGELFLGGAGLARGYFGRPDLTAERFVPDPAAFEGGARLYRTGDLARWLSDGRLDLVGRIDEQVKIRGFRVEPGEIEAALASLPGVRRAAVLVRELPSGDRRLAGGVEAAANLDPEALRTSLLERLPAHLVPAELVVLQALPLSPNGKVDRLALRSLLAGRTEAPRPAAPPADALEQRLAAIWEELLEVRGVSRDDGFFALGGHSLLAVRLLARIEKDLGRRLPLAALFRNATLATLAAALRAAPETGPRSGLEAPLSLLQRGEGRPSFWFHPLGGRALCYADLARQLPGLTLYGVEADGRPAATLAELADRYAQTVLRQSGAPHVLGGWSFGGLLAWETAYRLQERGEEVALVVLIDSRPPESPGQAAEPDGALVDALLRAELAGAAALAPPELSAYERTVRAHREALRGYRPRPLASPVTLFLAAERPAGESEDRAALWRPLVMGDLQVETVPGDHLSIVREPAVAVLAERLRERIASICGC